MKAWVEMALMSPRMDNPWFINDGNPEIVLRTGRISAAIRQTGSAWAREQRVADGAYEAPPAKQGEHQEYIDLFSLPYAVPTEQAVLPQPVYAHQSAARDRS